MRTLLYSTGAKIACLLRYSDANKAEWDRKLTPEQEKYVYHAELFIGEQRVMLCDNLDVTFRKSTALSLVVTFDTKEEVKQAYEILCEVARQFIRYKAQHTALALLHSLIDLVFGGD